MTGATAEEVDDDDGGRLWSINYLVMGTRDLCEIFKSTEEEVNYFARWRLLKHPMDYLGFGRLRRYSLCWMEWFQFVDTLVELFQD